VLKGWASSNPTSLKEIYRTSGITKGNEEDYEHINFTFSGLML
jgi:hypothetical protein